MALEFATPKFGGRWIDAADAEISGAKLLGIFNAGIDGVTFSTLEVGGVAVVLADYGLDHKVTAGVSFLTLDTENITKINLSQGGAWFYFATEEQDGKG